MEPCPHPNKMRFESRGDARAAIRQRKRGGHMKDLVPYRCVCSLWHLTSKAHTGRKRQAAKSWRPAR